MRGRDAGKGKVLFKLGLWNSNCIIFFFFPSFQSSRVVELKENNMYNYLTLIKYHVEMGVGIHCWGRGELSFSICSFLAIS